MPNHAIVLLASCFLFLVSCDEFEIRDLKLDRKNLLFNSRIAEEWAGMTYTEIKHELGEPYFEDSGVKYFSMWRTDNKRRILYIYFKTPDDDMGIDDLNDAEIEGATVYITDWRERFYKN